MARDTRLPRDLRHAARSGDIAKRRWQEWWIAVCKNGIEMIDHIFVDAQELSGVELGELGYLNYRVSRCWRAGAVVVVRSITRPLAALSDTAESFGKKEHAPALPETGSRVRQHGARLCRYARADRPLHRGPRPAVRLNLHDLRTPITRLKLRAELRDDEALRDDFEEGSDKLDMMVKGALQYVNDSDIDENPTAIRIDNLLRRLVKSAHLAGHDVDL